MPEYNIVRRRFEALKFPKGSPERNRLNRSSITSEFARHCPYLIVKGDKPVKSVESIEQAREIINNPEAYKQKVRKYNPTMYMEGQLWSRKRKKYFTSLY